MIVTQKVRGVLLHMGLTTISLLGLVTKCSAQADSWLPVADMSTARAAPGATVGDGKVYVIGGSPSLPNRILSSIEEYDPVANTWTTRSDMPSGRRWLSAVTVGEKIYTIGGEQQSLRAMPTVEEYDIPTDTWTAIADMPTPRKAASAAVVDGKVYVIGGAGRNDQLLTTVDMFDPITGTWESRARMPTARALLSTSVVDGKIYAFGGGPGSPRSTVEEYDPVADTWMRKSSMPTARWGLATSVQDGIIFASGGHNGSSPISTVEKYDPLADQWTVTEPLPVNSVGLASVAIDNQIYAIGGTPVWAAAPTSDSVYRFDPRSSSRPAVVLSATGEAYTQRFDSAFGPNGSETGVMLPNGWLGTTEHNYEVIDGKFSTTRTLRSGNFFNAGMPNEADRALAIKVPERGDAGGLQFDATVQGSNANRMRLQFDLEAWGAKSRSPSAPAGEAAFHVLAEIDLGGGFEDLIDLGIVTTGPNLKVPDDRLINGNDTPFRTQYDSGWKDSVTIPEDATLRLRWNSVMNEATAGWTFGLDNVRLELSHAQVSVQLLPGDSDQDLDFDQFDLIKVQQAGKYLSGQPATWGEGDWNGAPGGSAGSPPAGDNLFNQLDIIAALGADAYLTGPYSAVKTGGTKGDGQTSLVYDATSGELRVDPPAGTDLTSINVTSASGKFIGSKPVALDGAFDNFDQANIFKATFGGSFGSVSFGNVAQSGLSEEFLLGDLSIRGSLAGGGDLGNVDLVYVPEPTSVLLLSVGLAIGLVSFRRVYR